MGRAAGGLREPWAHVAVWLEDVYRWTAGGWRSTATLRVLHRVDPSVLTPHKTSRGVMAHCGGEETQNACCGATLRRLPGNGSPVLDASSEPCQGAPVGMVMSNYQPLTNIDPFVTSQMCQSVGWSRSVRRASEWNTVTRDVRERDGKGPFQWGIISIGHWQSLLQ